MAPKYSPLPKTVDTRVARYLVLPKDSKDLNKFSRHALRISQNGKLDIYGYAVYDFSDPRFPGKGCFSNVASQPITIDGVDFLNIEHYMRVMSSEDPAEAASLFFGDPVSTPKINPKYDISKMGLLRIAVRAKVSQHLDTAGELLITGNKYMAYTTANEYYGTGFDGRGSNVLGELYMDARDDMLRTILQQRKIHPIPDPTQEDINNLAKHFQDMHPDNALKEVQEMTGHDIGDIMNMTYAGSPKQFSTPKEFDNRSLLASIRNDERYKSYKPHDRFEYFRPHSDQKDYHDLVNDAYQKVYNKKEGEGVKMVHSLREYRDPNPFFKPIDFLFRGVGPIPGPAPLAVISAVVCFGLIASGVGAIAVAVVAIAFSAVSGAVQAYKSSQENGLDRNKTIMATVLGAVSGALAPWPGLGPLMSALYVKAVEKGLQLGKGAIGLNFPKKEEEKKETPKQPSGVEVMQHEQKRSVDVIARPCATPVRQTPSKNRSR